MVVAIIYAFAEVLLGLFIYQFLDQEKANRMNRLLRVSWVDIEARVFGVERNIDVVKKANKFVLKYCIVMSAATLLDGFLSMFWNIVDIKNILLMLTMVIAIPLRYLYIVLAKH